MFARLIGLFFLISAELFACPFCDQGGTDAALFILAVFIPFAAAIVFVILAIRRLEAKSPPSDPSRKIFEAEKAKE